MLHWDYLSLAFITLLAAGAAVWLFSELTDMLAGAD